MYDPYKERTYSNFQFSRARENLSQKPGQFCIFPGRRGSAKGFRRDEGLLVLLSRRLGLEPLGYLNIVASTITMIC